MKEKNRKQMWKCNPYGNIILACVLMLFAVSVNANTLQQKGITGIVTDMQGVAIIGANIVEKGTTNGAVTDIDGNFAMHVAGNESVLEVSYIGYVKQEVVVGSAHTLSIKLKEDTHSLDELVVVGYSVQKKKDLTGAVSVLKLDDVKNTPVSSVDQMMQGKLAGVNVIADNSPGGGVAVRVRGFSTIRNNDPLYIVDGVPVEGGINFLNPNDIESMQVLKDASSASIYGARAANGVVIISTKQGSKGKFNLNFDAYMGLQTISKSMVMMDAKEFGQMLWAAQKNDGRTPSSDVYGKGSEPVIPAFLDKNNRLPAGNLNWVDEITQNAQIQSYNLSLSKGDEQSKQLFSIGYFDQMGLFKYTGFKRLSGRFNSEYTLFNNALIIGENLTLAHGWGTSVTNNSALGGMLYDAYKTVAITPVYDLDGNFGSNPLADLQNPLGRLFRNKDNKNQESRVFGSIYLQLQLLEGLIFKTNFGGDYKNRYRRFFSPKFVEINTQQPLSTLSTANNWVFNYVFTNTLNYLHTYDKHTIGALLGMEAIENHDEYFTASRNGFASDDPNFRYLDAGSGDSQMNAGAAYTSKMLSYFGKIDYNFDNRYLLGLTLRRDGSSKLGDNKWGNFPAASFGWRISSEPFFNTSLISNLKLRAGWGQNGNSDIPAYSSIDSYQSNPYHSNYPMQGQQNSVNTGYTKTRNGNKKLKWETTTQTNVGLDIGMLNNALSMTLDWFKKDTKDILWNRLLIGTMGGTNQTIWDNVGKMLNSGIEAEISYRQSLNNDFGFNATFNAAALKNELKELKGGIDYIGLPSAVLHSVNFDQEVSRSAVGYPIGSFFGYKEDGLFQNQSEIDAYTNSKGEKLLPNAKPGDIKFVDVNGDGKIDGKDRTFLGSPQPDFTMGLTLGANYKNVDITLFFQSMFGNEVYDLTRYVGDFYNQAQYNKNKRVLHAWSAENSQSSVPRVTQDDPNNNIRPSSYYVSDASFFRFKNLKIGYALPKNITSRMQVEKLYLYVQANNLFTISKYEGIDPEVGLQNYSNDYRNIDMGVDRGIYPLSRTFTVGLNLSL